MYFTKSTGEDILHYKYSIEREGKSADSAHKGFFENKFTFRILEFFCFYYIIGFLEKSASIAHREILEKKLKKTIVKIAVTKVRLSQGGTVTNAL